MTWSRSEAVAFGRAVLGVVREEDVSFLAAAVAYYAFVSVVPLALLVLVGASLIAGERLATRLIVALGGAVSPVEEALIRETLVTASGRTSATVVSLLLLTWSGLRLFRGLDVAFARVYGTTPSASFLDRLSAAVAVLAAVGASGLALLAVGVAISASGVAVTGVVGTVALVVVLAVTFFPVFFLLPARKASPLVALPGTVVAAVGFTVLGTAFRVYAENATAFALYGVLGAALLLVTWFYAASLLVLVGAACNAVYEGRETGNYNRPHADTSPNDRP